MLWFKQLLCSFGRHSWKAPQQIMHKKLNGRIFYWNIRECKACGKREYEVYTKYQSPDGTITEDLRRSSH